MDPKELNTPVIEGVIDNSSKSFELTFSVNRSCIATVPYDEQNGDLLSLGIDIYEQETFEKEILNQVDKALGKEDHIRNGMKTGTWSKDKGLNVDEKEAPNSDSTTDTHNDSQISSIISISHELEENELLRKVRIGEMTPFGTCLSFKTSEENCFDKVEKYLKEQIEAEKKRKNLKRKTIPETHQPNSKKNSSSLKKNIFFPKKRRNTQKLGTFISKEIDDLYKNPGKAVSKTPFEESSDSEYNPFGSEQSDSDVCVNESFPKKRRKNANTGAADSEDWKTDDSDWEYSEDENKKKLKRKLRAVRREQDDGDFDKYLKRLKQWESNNNREEIETNVKTLDGGFKVPLVIWNKLFNYQKIGIHWLWELNSQRCGGILGDEMGLGKTVQVIAFLSGLAVSKLVSHHGSYTGLGPVLIVCPTTVMHQWIRELHSWWPQFRAALMHESGNYNGKRSKLIQDIIKTKGVLVTSFVSCVQNVGTLARYSWHYVILDEGHKIRNPESQITNAVKQLKTPHRLILSGSPMQNNLKELWSLFDFIFPGKLGTLPVFMSEFAVPITQGGYANASKVQVATAYKCAKVLRDTISPYLLRRMKEDVKKHINLPMKNEQVLFCKLTDEQKHLYLEYLNSSEVSSILSGRYKVFVGLINLRKICNHPHLYSGGPKVFKRNGVDSVPEQDRYGYWKKAGKMIVVETLLKIWKKQDHRVLIFTQSKKMLHILEYFVQNQGYEYLRLDGSTNISSRQPIIRKFNEDKKYFVFLSTTQVGGLGVNLTGADRVVIYDPDWNPATDTQARERAWRIGQMNQVTIYRLVTSGTIEEKIYHRQIFKQFLTNKVLRDPKQRRFFKSNDLYELFTLKDTETDTTETSALFAGCGSEVNLRSLSKRLRVRHKCKSNGKIQKVKPSDVLSREKVESMKQLAKMLSQKIGNGDISSVSKAKTTIPSSSNEIRPEFEETSKNKSEGRKRSTLRFAMFEGETVPYLTRKLDYKEFSKLENENRKEQDDYILGKLFSKSGIKTALQHDKIMEDGPSDYALVEGEAEKVAKEAVRALKESRRHYFLASESMIEPVKPRFGNKSNKTRPGAVVDAVKKETKGFMSSSELLSRIKERNRLLNNDQSFLPCESVNEQLELLTDIRNFVSFEAELNNVATTQEIVNRFRDRLPSGTSPLFRALLLEICEFHRNSEGQGMWRLRGDFRW